MLPPAHSVPTIASNMPADQKTQEASPVRDSVQLSALLERGQVQKRCSTQFSFALSLFSTCLSVDALGRYFASTTSILAGTVQYLTLACLAKSCFSVAQGSSIQVEASVDQCFLHAFGCTEVRENLSAAGALGHVLNTQPHVQSVQATPEQRLQASKADLQQLCDDISVLEHTIVKTEQKLSDMREELQSKRGMIRYAEFQVEVAKEEALRFHFRSASRPSANVTSTTLTYTENLAALPTDTLASILEFLHTWECFALSPACNALKTGACAALSRVTVLKWPKELASCRDMSEALRERIERELIRKMLPVAPRLTDLNTEMSLPECAELVSHRCARNITVIKIDFLKGFEFSFSRQNTIDGLWFLRHKPPSQTFPKLTYFGLQNFRVTQLSDALRLFHGCEHVQTCMLSVEVCGANSDPSDSSAQDTLPQLGFIHDLRIHVSGANAQTHQQLLGLVPYLASDIQRFALRVSRGDCNQISDALQQRFAGSKLKVCNPYRNIVIAYQQQYFGDGSWLPYYM